MEKKSFNQLLKDLEGCKDVAPIIKAQKSTLLRYEEINEMLRQFLELSHNTQSMLLENYTEHTNTLVELKKDLEISFRRIRALKTKLKVEYPDAFEATSAAIKELEEINRHFQEDDNENNTNTSSITTDDTKTTLPDTLSKNVRETSEIQDEGKLDTVDLRRNKTPEPDNNEINGVGGDSKIDSSVESKEIGVKESELTESIVDDATNELVKDTDDPSAGEKLSSQEWMEMNKNVSGDCRTVKEEPN